MFSKKTMVVAGAIILIALNVLVFSFTYIRKSSVGDAAARATLYLISPFQTAVSAVIDFTDDVWEHYFFLISVARENDELKKKLGIAVKKNNECNEIALSNERLRKYVNLKKQSPYNLLAAKVIAKDPAPWFKTMIINKGTEDGVIKGLPVMVPEGVVGYVTTASSGFAKVLLIIDRNSSVDAMVQRNRARGVVQGDAQGLCRFDYALRKLDITVGDTIVSSGFDGIYPKGLRIGSVSKVIRRNSGLFQAIELTPFVDFKKLEEVMIILNPLIHDFVSNQ